MNTPETSTSSNVSHSPQSLCHRVLLCVLGFHRGGKVQLFSSSGNVQVLLLIQRARDGSVNLIERAAIREMFFLRLLPAAKDLIDGE